MFDGWRTGWMDRSDREAKVREFLTGKYVKTVED